MIGPPSFDQSVARISFEGVDLSPLRPWARQRTPGLPDAELDRRISSNLQFIFHNLLNRRHFIVAPEPSDVITQITRILHLVDELNRLMEDGHRKISRDADPDKRLVEEIGQLAKRLHDCFTAYFTEGYDSAYQLDLRVSPDPTAQLLCFLSESEIIVRQLTDRTDDYFLSSAPASVSFEQYRSSSISVLSASLERLAELVTRRLESGAAR